jgi:hypothetical protein
MWGSVLMSHSEERYRSDMVCLWVRRCKWDDRVALSVSVEGSVWDSVKRLEPEFRSERQCWSAVPVERWVYEMGTVYSYRQMAVLKSVELFPWAGVWKGFVTVRLYRCLWVSAELFPWVVEWMV